MLINFVPNAQDTINQIAPLKIENGVVVEPVNSYKEAYFKIFDDDRSNAIKIVLDTKDDTIDLNKIKDDSYSIHLAKKNLYYVKKNEITSTDLSNISFNLEQKDYQEQMKKGVTYFVHVISVLMFFILTIYYLLYSLVFSVLSFFFTIGQENKPDFASRMRMSSLAVFLVTIVDLLLSATINVDLAESVYALAVALITLLFIRFVPIWKPAE